MVDAAAQFARQVGLVLCVVAAALVVSGTFASEPSGISGFVFDDLNLNGVRDDGELPALFTEITARDASTQEVVATGESLYQGYSLPLPEGIYTVETDGIHRTSGVVVDSFGGFSPLRLDDCICVAVQWPSTTPNPLTVTVTSAGFTDASFGLRPPDAAILAGIAVEDDHYADGEDILAYVNGIECGQGRSTGPPFFNGIHNFEITVLGEGERAGCASDGDVVTFEINGAPTSETLVFESNPTEPRFLFLISGEDYAWYWAERSTGRGSADGVVEAVINGKVCGAATIAHTTHASSLVSGFSRLIVPSTAIEPGCGEPGATVRFLVNGEDSGEEVLWGPGIYGVNPELVFPIVAGDADCNGETTPVDSLHVLRWDAWFRFVPCFNRADLDCDGLLTPVDSLNILRLDAGLGVTVC